MQNKFQCNYKLSLNWYEKDGQPKQATVTNPITIDFDITKSTQSQCSTRINIYNLDGETRENIYKDIVLLRRNETIKWVTLEAGYGDRLTLVSWGYIQQCSSVRRGTDMITTIEVIDPDILTEYCGVTFKAGTTYKQAYDYLVAQLPNLRIGECGVLAGEFKVPTVFNGNAYILLNQLTGRHTFVDNGVINTLGDNETLTDYGCYYIAADTGLLETPRRYDAILEITMLFEPTIKLGQLVEIQSSTQARFDGQYKVIGINHNCVISDAIAGNRITTLQLEYIWALPNSNVNLTSNPGGAPAAVVVNNETKAINTKYGSDIESIYRAVNDNNGIAPNKSITQRVSWREMLNTGKNQGADVKNQVTRGILQNCKEIAYRLTDFLNTYFPGQKITITSGFRTSQNNAATEGSSKNSYHKSGKAIDFTMPGVSTVELHNKFIKNWSYGLGVYSWGLHVSLDPNERFKGG